MGEASALRLAVGLTGIAALALSCLACRREHASTSAPAPPAPVVSPAGAPAAPVALVPPVGVGDAKVPPSSVGVPACSLDSSFSGVFAVPEASAATETELVAGVRELVVISDSGQDGLALAVTLPDGPSRELRLPLDKAAGDDTEGLAWHSGHLYALTSAGFVLAMTPDGRGGLTRGSPAYPLGPVPFVCDVADDVNCGKNYEGLCLRSGRSARCAGYAASRTEGALYCLSLTGDRLQIDQTRPPLVLPVRRDSLSDCAFGSGDGPAANALVIATNLHGGSQVYVVDESTGGISPIAVPGILNDEAVAIDHTGALYQAMDDNGTPSPANRAVCRW
jgi:hypothetical protein